jgi:hypothetical protein
VVLVLAWLGAHLIASGPAARERALERAAAASAPDTSTAAAHDVGAAGGTTTYAARLAALLAALGRRSHLALRVRVDLQPRAGGAVGTPQAVARYRRRVRGAAIAIALDDDAARHAWRQAGAAGDAATLRSWSGLLRTLLPGARIAIVVLDGGLALARADLARGDRSARVRLVGG